MKIKIIALLFATHAGIALLGFAVGIYMLPIIISPPAPTQAALADASSSELYRGEFRRDLKDSDALHWGEGSLSVGSEFISFTGKLAPGPDYQLYLSPQFIETEADFIRFKSNMTHVGSVKTFNNFIVDVPSSVDVSKYTSVIVWCESFGQFITAAKYH